MAYKRLPKRDPDRLRAIETRIRNWKLMPYCWRINRALARLSRDRWLSGHEVTQLAITFARSRSAHPFWSAQQSYPSVCRVVGMMRGKPPFDLGEPEYGMFMRATEKLKRNDAAQAEMLILKLTLERKLNER